MNKIIHSGKHMSSRYDKETLRINQFIIAMKMFLLFLAFSLQVSASVFSQQITLSVKKAPLKGVLQDIRKQSGYSFLLQMKFLKQTNPVTITLTSIPLEEALDRIFEGQPFGYVIRDRVIVVVPRTENEKSESSTFLNNQNKQDKAAPIAIQGKVLDETGKPLIGVNVRVKGTNIGTVTDQNGNYTVNTEPNSILIFSYIGYVTEEIKINGRTEINLNLKEYQSQLNETVVKGYYVTTTALNTGTVSTLKAREIEKQPVGNVLFAMEGRIPGLYISQSSGVPGSSPNVRLRGQNSIGNGNNPFYIVDGVPFTNASLTQNYGAASNISPFASINPQDIESIDVLKDADATAIYGSRGANGVILITTKKGKAGNNRVNAQFSSGIEKVARRLKLMNTQQYLEMRAEGMANDNQSIRTTDYDVNGAWDQSRYTDWQKVMIGGTAQITNAALTISGGSEQTQFLISGAYRRETTVMPGDNSNRLGSVGVNISQTSSNKKFEANFKTNYSYGNNRLPQTDLSRYIFIAPNAPKLYTSNGQLNWENSTFNNPLGALNIRSSSTTKNLISNLELSYEIIKNLKVKNSLGYSDIHMNDEVITPFTAYNPDLPNAASYRSNGFGTNEINSIIIEPQLTYSVRISDHNLESLIGITFQKNHQARINHFTSGFANDALITNPLAATTNRISGFDDINYRYNAIYARLGYSYKERYLLNLTGRRDGSSRFGPGKQFGNFGAIGAGWIFTRESFMSRLSPVLSYGKLRGSIGKTGNDQLPDYQYLSTYSANGQTYNGVSILNPTSLANPNFGWETINKTEAAIELGFLKDRFHLDVNWYRNSTGNQLVGYTLPSTTGFNSIQANLPAVIENKGLEFDLTSTNVILNKLTWISSFNISFPNNKLVAYPNIQSSTYKNVYAIGQPLSINFLYGYNGIDQQSGQYTFKDYTGDDKVSYNDDRKAVFVGQKYFGGLNNTLSYEGFTLDIFFQFVKQSGYNLTFYGTPGQFNANQPTAVIDRWRKPGDQSEFQKYSSKYGTTTDYIIQDSYNASDGRVMDASFIRLKNVNISWAIPRHWEQRLKLQNVRIFLQGQNLWTISRYKGIDPETNNFGIGAYMPPLLAINAGIQITL